jgi:hypothetical protein
LLDLMKADAPRFDSVTSTEGDMACHPESTSKDPSGKRICELMHPRLKERAKEWGKQYVVFDTAQSCPMFILTVKKVRNSPYGLQQLIDDDCDIERIRALGFTAADFKARGKTASQLKKAGFSAADLRAAGFGLSDLDAANYDLAELKRAGFQDSELSQVCRMWDLSKMQQISST